MTRLQHLAVCGTAALVLACGAARKAHDPFSVPREQFYPSLRVVALAPLAVPDDLTDAELVKARFTTLLQTRLGRAGLSVVSPADVAPVVEATHAEAGGVFDPVTGRANPDRLRGREAAVARALRERFQADALLEPAIVVVAAPLSRDVAQWHGTTERAAKGGVWKSLVQTHSGTLPALSLVVRLTGADGRRLYANAGGIQVLGNVTLGGSIEPVPRAELFASDERNAGAVRLALQPLTADDTP